MNVVLRDLDFHFQGQTFPCCAFAAKENAQTADVPDRFASTRTAPAVELLLFRFLFCQSVRPYVRPYVRSSIRPSFSPPVRPCVRSIVHPSILQSTRPSVRPIVHPSILQSTRPSIRPPPVCSIVLLLVLPYLGYPHFPSESGFLLSQSASILLLKFSVCSNVCVFISLFARGHVMCARWFMCVLVCACMLSFLIV